LHHEPQAEYILGVDSNELERLWSQHRVWEDEMRALLSRAGLASGHVVLDLGCGPGTTSLELARCVGSRGKVLAVDESRACIHTLSAEAQRLGLDNIEASIRSVEKLALEPESLDAAYGRWILSWVADVPAVFEQVTCALRPGGAYIMQEYLDWQAMKLLPRSQVFETAIQACMQSWTRGVGKINIAEEVPALACAAGLKVESFDVNARSGQPGTPVWNWLGEFLQSYLARLVRQGAFGQSDHEAFCSEWSERTQGSDSVIIAPVVADVVLRRPG